MPHITNVLRTLGILILGYNLLTSAIAAQEKPNDKSQQPRSVGDTQETKQATNKRRKPGNVDVDAFVAKQLPDLSKVLTHLKEQRKDQYQKVSRDLERSIQRLENLRDRDKKLYEVELQLWKTQSQLQIIAARYSVRPPKDEKDEQVITIVIRKLLDRVSDLEIQRLKILRANAVQQLAKYDREIAAYEKELTDEQTREDKMRVFKRRAGK